MNKQYGKYVTTIKGFKVYYKEVWGRQKYTAIQGKTKLEASTLSRINYEIEYLDYWENVEERYRSSEIPLVPF